MFVQFFSVVFFKRTVHTLPAADARDANSKEKRAREESAPVEGKL